MLVRRIIQVLFLLFFDQDNRCLCFLFYPNVAGRAYCGILYAARREGDHENNSSQSLNSGVSVQSLALYSRKHALTTAAALVTSPLVAAASPSNTLALDKDLRFDDDYDLDCLCDLPPLGASTHVRIYLCRHGQTENNRLHRMQGARSNEPINAIGEAQATRLGKALARAHVRPERFFYSPLMRAQQTANVAAIAMAQQDRTMLRGSPIASPSLTALESLVEVDFGPISEGIPVQRARLDTRATYAAWAVGNVDVRMKQGGESGREILNRVSNVMQMLIDHAATTQSKSVAAVTHSAILRMILATLAEKPLMQVVLTEQKNACINVLDLRCDGFTRIVPSNSPLLGGPLSLAPTDFALQIPDASILRINEKRHLGRLVT